MKFSFSAADFLQACYGFSSDSNKALIPMATQTAANPIREKLLKGLSLQQAGEIEKAQRYYKQVLKKQPSNPDALNLLGVTYRQLGFPKRALEFIQKAIKIDSDQSVFYANLARVMMDLGTDPDSLLAICNKSLSLNPREREARNIKAIALTKLKKFEEAEYLYQGLIVEFPEYVEAYQNFAELLMEAGQSGHAIKLFSKAIIENPDNPQNFILRARCRMKLEQLEPSQMELSEALTRFPDNGDVKHEAARLLFRMNETTKAISFATEAYEADPTNYHKCVTLGVNLLMSGKPKEALKLLQKAKKKAPPVSPTVDWNISLAYLANGDLKRGWDLHMARFEDPGSTVMKRKFQAPVWQGEDISDKTILIWADQGLGDALKSGTMIPDLFKNAEKVILEGSEKGVKFFKYSFPEAICRTPTMDANKDATASDYDVQVSITDLARFYRPSIEAFEKAPCPVYSFDRERAVSYLKRLDGYQDKPVIGFSWRSGNLAVSRARYYLSVTGIAPLLESQDAIFVNLQYSPVEKEIAFLKNNFPDKFHFFDDVDLFNDLLGAAALTACCDFVVSANTSVADICGIYNVPTIRFGTEEHPLLLGQDNPPWYPQMTYMHSYKDRPAADFVPEIIKELDRRMVDWTPDRRNARLGI
ncbi:tetratricopeptide repeat protein [Parasphingorhabdus sp.]|uniref:tetratricopeptide repeat protein n=1 Tax=Parasphingorhabdus sp. TaxID=2709688 RepID=UPI00329A38AE